MAFGISATSAILIGGGLAAAGGIGGALISSGAQEDAARTQADAAKNATQVQWDMFLRQQENQQPFLQAGTNAVNYLSEGLKPGGQFAQTQPTLAQLQMDPGYAWRTRQGNNAITAAGAAAGNLGSGNLGVALQNYGQNAASQEYQNAYNRWQNGQTLYENRLAALAGVGQTATGQIGQAGQATANNVSNIATGLGNNLAQAQVGAANAWAGGLNNMTNAFTSGLNNYQNQLQQNQLMNAFTA